MRLCRADEILKLEAASQAECGISPARLMDAAGAALYEALMHRLPVVPAEILILCGPGNNGADGYTLAALCRAHGIAATVIAVFPPQSSLCRQRAYSCNTLSSPLFSWEGDRVLCERLIQNAAVIVDCVFGVGYDATREPDERFTALCRALSDSHAFILAADVPSGLDADRGIFYQSGQVPTLIFADATVTFSYSKPALETAPGIHAAGQVFVSDVGLPAEIAEKTSESCTLLDREIRSLLPKRKADTSKANYGKLLSYCGSSDMPGAAVLAAGGAIRSGVGLLTCTSDAHTLSVLQHRYPEPIYLPLKETSEGTLDLSRSRDLLSRRASLQSAILVGCGIGTGKEPEALLETLLAGATCPIVCDADALTILSSRGDLLAAYGEKFILTPHPGEMGRLIQKTPAEVQLRRIDCALEFAARYGCIVVLKGYRTVIASPDEKLAICPLGNPGMAKAGMGDLLAGIIASLAAQKLPPFDAARLGVYLHARAGDLARDALGEASLLPSDVLDFLPRAFTE